MTKTNSNCRTCGHWFDDEKHVRCEHDICFHCMDKRFRASCNGQLRSFYRELHGIQLTYAVVQRCRYHSDLSACYEHCPMDNGNDVWCLDPVCFVYRENKRHPRKCDRSIDACFCAWSQFGAQHFYDYVDIILRDHPDFKQTCFDKWLATVLGGMTAKEKERRQKAAARSVEEWTDAALRGQS